MSVRELWTLMNYVAARLNGDEFVFTNNKDNLRDLPPLVYITFNIASLIPQYETFSLSSLISNDFIQMQEPCDNVKKYERMCCD